MGLVVLTCGIVIAILGGVGVVVPTMFLDVTRPFLTPVGPYAAALVRLVLGAALFMAAPTSRAPRTLRIIGVVIIIGGLVTPLIGVERARAIVAWWADHGSAILHIWGGVALAFGLLLVYAVALRTPAGPVGRAGR